MCGTAFAGQDHGAAAGAAGPPHPAEQAQADCRFVARGSASPDLPLRLINLFVQQDFAFDHVTVERADDRYVVAIEMAGLDLRRARIILEKMRAMVFVEEADLHLALSVG